MRLVFLVMNSQGKVLLLRTCILFLKYFVRKNRRNVKRKKVDKKGNTKIVGHEGTEKQEVAKDG